uniref:Transposase Helix-turn-helix domain-containing protein n=1 Tax=Amphimedon queenslandica TaxID=400682 RepID=A0A1X7U532_AMPQE
MTDLTSYHHFVSPLIKRQDTVMRQAISPGERLAVTLRFLATGESYSILQYIYRIPAQTISKIVPDTCRAIVKALKHHIQILVWENEKFPIFLIDANGYKRDDC